MSRRLRLRRPVRLDIHAIFGVPGTNEIPIIDGTSDPAAGVRYVRCLHENIAVGAARATPG